jgi:CBS domain-containing protein
VKLVDLLEPRRIVIPLGARTLREAAAQLVDTLVTTQLVERPDKLGQVLGERLPPEIVTHSGQAFLLHFRTDAVRRLTVALGIAPEPVIREGRAGKSARIVVLIVAPPRDAAAYLQTVSTFDRIVAGADVVDGLLRATTPADVLAHPPLAQVEMPGELMVRDFMTARVLSVRADATVEDAARLIVRHNVPSLPVVGAANEVLGMVSHRGLLRMLLPRYVTRVSTGEFLAPAVRQRRRQDDASRMPVRDAMDRSVLCVSEDQTLADVASVMVNKDIDRFPVVRDGALVGFITRGDIVRRIFGP